MGFVPNAAAAAAADKLVGSKDGGCPKSVFWTDSETQTQTSTASGGAYRQLLSLSAWSFVRVQTSAENSIDADNSIEL